MTTKSATVVVTGAAGGLGEALVRSLEAVHDCSIIAVCRAPDLGYSTGDRVTVCGGVDLMDDNAFDSVVQAVRRAPSQRLGVANCTGYFPGYMSIEDTPADAARRSMESNYLTVFNSARRLLPIMKERGGGVFLAFVSHSGYQAFPLMASFDAPKAAVIQLVRHIAHEGAEAGVLANALALATLDSAAERQLKPFGDHGHWLPPSGVAAIASEMLLRPLPYVTGNVLHVYRHSDSYYGQSYFDRVRNEDRR